MSAGASSIYRQLLQTVHALPRDPLRPTLQLNEMLESTINRAFGVRQIQATTSATSPNEALPLKNVESVSAEDEALASKALQILKDLKEDKALHAVSATCGYRAWSIPSRG
jgi:hypothetical protein